MKKRIAAGMLAAGVVFGAVYGLAASLTVTTKTLASGTGTITACDGDGVTVDYAYDGASGKITHVLVQGIQDGSANVGSGACDGKTIYADVLGSGDSLLETVTAASHTGDTNIDDDSETMDLATDRAPADVAKVRITIKG